MIYKNPVLKGFYPDPSVCFANGKYYLVTSTFQYFPGVALFESDNLVNWKQIGYVLTRPEQVMLDKIPASGGVFAPTIRYNNGRFYMVTTNDTTHRNFYVYTDDIYGEWSDPIEVDQGGIDPSLYFEDGRTFFISNGQDDYGESGVVQCEIDIATGKKLSHSKSIWKGSGGRYLESPHLYKINGSYYLMAAEGGTEYGHMITYARSDNPWGPFTNYPYNPVLTNRNKAPFLIQGIGHGDLIQDTHGDWWVTGNRCKTDTQYVVKLLPAALSILERYRDGADRVFAFMPHLNTVDRSLKRIAVLCGIDKKLTFHCARHTYATTICLMNGVSLETLSKMLGHKRITTTQTYAKVTQPMIDREVEMLKEKLADKFMAV